MKKIFPRVDFDAAPRAYPRRFRVALFLRSAPASPVFLATTADGSPALARVRSNAAAFLSRASAVSLAERAVSLASPGTFSFFTIESV